MAKHMRRHFFRDAAKMRITGNNSLDAPWSEAHVFAVIQIFFHSRIMYKKRLGIVSSLG